MQFHMLSVIIEVFTTLGILMKNILEEMMSEPEGGSSSASQVNRRVRTRLSRYKMLTQNFLGPKVVLL